MKIPLSLSAICLFSTKNLSLNNHKHTSSQLENDVWALPLWSLENPCEACRFPSQYLPMDSVLVIVNKSSGCRGMLLINFWGRLESHQAGKAPLSLSLPLLFGLGILSTIWCIPGKLWTWKKIFTFPSRPAIRFIPNLMALLSFLFFFYCNRMDKKCIFRKFIHFMHIPLHSPLTLHLIDLHDVHQKKMILWKKCHGDVIKFLCKCFLHIHIFSTFKNRLKTLSFNPFSD